MIRGSNAWPSQSHGPSGLAHSASCLGSINCQRFCTGTVLSCYDFKFCFPARTIQTSMTNHFEEGKAPLKKRQQLGLPPVWQIDLEYIHRLLLIFWSEAAAIISWGCYHWRNLPLVSTLQRWSCSHVWWWEVTRESCLIHGGAADFPGLKGLWEIAQAGQNAWSLSNCAIV